jgi:hypothetical protein
MPRDDATVARYRQRAAELRSIAAQTEDIDDRETILRAAEAYERMADWKPGNPVSKPKETS